ncbi:lactonase family protein [Pseudomonas putida]|uniref:lactonase family protein n=1 Tax=Pseudomonas putida TaxID=303 RepID=UPI002168EDB5|nr:lactonase family protein [Pseudomonas putida]MCS4063759.1 6-phosphogluconolactonase (cycloisomerase 2 family) [Pseudomonas putida]
MFAYVGSRTTEERNARGIGISVYRLDQERGVLELIQQVEDLVNPSFLAVNRAGDRLYTVHGDRSDVSAFRIDNASGYLELLNTQCCEGKNPVHLALSADERHLVVSNHITGTLAVMEVDDQGAVGSVVQLVALDGPPGPHRTEQPFPKPHFNLFDPTGQFVLVPDKGLDRIFSFRFEQGRLTPAQQPFVITRENAGPRHIALNPNLPCAYAVNELDSSVTTYDYDAQTGGLQAGQILSLLPEYFTGNSRASEVEIDRTGRFLYASNRGYDSIVMFAIDQVTGWLKLIDWVPSGGATPRFFSLTPNGRFLFALNEDSDTLQAFEVCQESGRLSATGHVTHTGSPVCMVFVGD